MWVGTGKKAKGESLPAEAQRAKTGQKLGFNHKERSTTLSLSARAPACRSDGGAGRCVLFMIPGKLTTKPACAAGAASQTGA